MDLKKLDSDLLELCHEIEKLPAGEQQTNAAMKAGALHHRVQAELYPEVHGRKELQPHQQRVVDEKAELNEKLNKLTSFVLDSPIFKDLPQAERGRLLRQMVLMQLYSEVLADRIAAFE